MQGVIKIEVKFETLGLVYPFYIIKDLHHSLILGHEFAESHNVTLDIRDKKMIIQDNIKVCSLQTNTGYARTVKPVILPAKHCRIRGGKEGRSYLLISKASGSKST